MIAGLLLAACISIAPDQAPKAVPDLLTVPEKTDFRKTSHYADVVAFVDAAVAASSHAKRSTLGKTVEGRDIPLLIISEEGAATSGDVAALAAKGKLVVFLFGNIHAGEVDGKEGLQMLARDLVAGDLRPLLKDLVILIAPIYNCDGNEKFSATNRPGQIGPDEMGVRENSHGRDLNRDFIKLEEPETQGLVKLLNNFDPNLIVDCHTTNGSYHRYLISFAGPKVPAGDADLIKYSRETWFPSLKGLFESTTQWKSFWYGSFEGAFTDAPRGHNRWETFPAEARYGTSYFGLRNRLSTLVESYSYSTFKDRILGSHAFCRNILQLAAKNKDEIRAIEAKADQRAISNGKTIGDNDTVALRTSAAAWPDKVDVLGFEEEVIDGHVKNTGTLKTYKVDLFDRFITEKAVVRPFGYLIRDEPDLRPILAKLRDHGIEVRKLAEETSLPIEALTVKSAKPAAREYQGHVCVQVETTAAASELSFNAGTWFIPAGQPLGNLACYLLEPDSEDGLVTWNYFDLFIPVGAEFPVYRLMQARDFRSDVVP